MFDYVRFPSDGDVENTVYGRTRGLAKNDAVPAFLKYAASRLEPSACASRPPCSGSPRLGTWASGRFLAAIAKHVHAIYAMTYPSLFGSGELGLADPGAAPGATVSRRSSASTGRSRAECPAPAWVQDFSFTVPYGKDEVRAQIYSARIAGAKGYLLWNARGEYTSGR